MEINGVAPHIRVNVDRFEECVEFYDQLLPFLGLEVVHRSDEFVYYVGGRTGYYVARAAGEHAPKSQASTDLGLDHICFRARARDDIDELFGFLKDIGARMVREPEEGPWAPGYYGGTHVRIRQRPNRLGHSVYFVYDCKRREVGSGTIYVGESRGRLWLYGGVQVQRRPPIRRQRCPS